MTDWRLEGRRLPWTQEGWVKEFEEYKKYPESLGRSNVNTSQPFNPKEDVLLGKNSLGWIFFSLVDRLWELHLCMTGCNVHVKCIQVPVPLTIDHAILWHLVIVSCGVVTLQGTSACMLARWNLMSSRGFTLWNGSTEPFLHWKHFQFTDMKQSQELII